MKESEGKEMKKQELVKNIKSLARESSQQWPHEEMVELPDVLRGINQLDDPEVLSQEWIRENKEMYLINDTSENAIPEYKLQNLLVPKQESLETSAPLIVPEDLGVLLEDMDLGKSSRYFTMIDALFHCWDNTVGSPTGDFIAENKKELIEIIIGNRGYEVEEQKYNVELKVRSSFGTVGVFLYKQGDEILAGDNFKAYYPEKDKFRLTEQEIKDFDPRCWEFRKPV